MTEIAANYRVVVNPEDQYSIWPDHLPLPAGWRCEGFSGSREHCLEHINRVWIDMTPRSLRAPALWAESASGRPDAADEGADRGAD